MRDRERTRGKENGWSGSHSGGHKALSVGLLAAALLAAPSAFAAESSAVVVMYHRFGEAKYPSTNTTIEQLESHIQELVSSAYAVLPVTEIIDRVRRGESLPDRTVGITVDDAYRSVYEVAWPRFRAAGLPFSVFVATGPVNQGSSTHMTWDQIRELSQAGTIIGNHTVSHLHMTSATAKRIRNEIGGAQRRYQKELGLTPGLFAYPYGEASFSVTEIVKSHGFKAAFGQHSGVIGSIGDVFYLPRFAMNEKYGDLARFKLAVNALPLPVSDVTPLDHLVTSPNPPAMGFTVKPGIEGLGRLACFLSHEGKAVLERLGPARIEVRSTAAFPTGRTRLNCTLPVGQGRWRWLGRQFYREP